MTKGDPTPVIRYSVRHRTTYQYSAQMSDGYTLTRLIPRTTDHQRVARCELHVDPEPDERRSQVDAFGNHVVQLGLHHSHAHLELAAHSDVDVTVPAEPGPGPRWRHVAAQAASLTGAAALDVRPFLAASTYVNLDAVGDGLRRLVYELAGRPAPTIDDDVGVVDLTRRLCAGIHSSFDYDPSATDISTPLATVIAERHGVCQDFAHVAIGGLRAIGIPARYVSGYLETARPDGPDALVGADASHAWASVWVPGGGWVDFDPTNDLLPTVRHVTVAWGRDYGDVAPVRGVVIGPPTAQTLSVAVESRRVTADRPPPGDW